MIRTSPDVRLDRDPYLTLQAVNIYVRDQDRSLQFYREQLGFDVAIDVRLVADKVAIVRDSVIRRVHLPQGQGSSNGQSRRS